MKIYDLLGHLQKYRPHFLTPLWVSLVLFCNHFKTLFKMHLNREHQSLPAQYFFEVVVVRHCLVALKYSLLVYNDEN